MKKVLILGSMNNLPTCYSSDLAQLGVDVIQIVGFSDKYQLHDPYKFLSETQLSKFKIVRLPFMHNFFLPAIASLYFIILKLLLPKSWNPDVVIFNDTFLTLGKYFDKKTKVFIPHGGDIETWCGFNSSTVSSLSESMKQAGIFQLMPYYIRKKYISFIIASFRSNLSVMDGVIYFPRKFTEVTKKIAQYCDENKMFYWERYDISLAPLVDRYLNSAYPNKSSEERIFKILVPVRFAYRTFPEGNDDFNKGSDLIIRGIEDFLSVVGGDNVEIVFYEKGVDVGHAKKLVNKTKFLKKKVHWRSSVPFNQFLGELEEADFCFDGVGNHWPGAVAAYGLALGINVGANFNKVRHLLPEDDLPHLYNISTVEDICNVLVACFKKDRSIRVSDELLNKIRVSYSTMNIAKRILNLL